VQSQNLDCTLSLLLPASNALAEADVLPRHVGKPCDDPDYEDDFIQRGYWIEQAVGLDVNSYQQAVGFQQAKERILIDSWGRADGQCVEKSFESVVDVASLGDDPTWFLRPQHEYIDVGQHEELLRNKRGKSECALGPKQADLSRDIRRLKQSLALKQLLGLGQWSDVPKYFDLPVKMAADLMFLARPCVGFKFTAIVEGETHSEYSLSLGLILRPRARERP
jgi:hypothetical protein